jgi:hypothetical protein
MSKVQIEDLWVKVTYEVRLADLKIPKEAFDEIIKSTEESRDVKMADHRYNEAYEWLSENIKEAHCMEWECEIIDIIPKEN